MKIHSPVEAQALVNKALRVLCQSNKLQLPVAVKYLALVKKCLQRQGYAALALHLDYAEHFATKTWPPSS